MLATNTFPNLRPIMLNVFPVLVALCSASSQLYSATDVQTSTWKTVSVPLPVVTSGLISVLLSVQKTGDNEVAALLTANVGTPPFAELRSDGSLHIEALSSDVTSFAYQSPYCFLRINSSELTNASSLEVGVLIPSLPYKGLNTTIRVIAHSTHHSDGDLCPNDCSSNGQCSYGVCTCRGGWAGEDCLRPVTILLPNEKTDMIVAEKSYSLIKVSYQSDENLGVALKVIQGEVVLLVSFGM